MQRCTEVINSSLTEHGSERVEPGMRSRDIFGRLRLRLRLQLRLRLRLRLRAKCTGSGGSDSGSGSDDQVFI